MNQHLKKILNAINEDKNLSEEEKNAIIKSLKDADKEFEIVNFKLDRTEKVKKTTAILLEETIEELEQKRKSVEAQNKELEIESSLERVRTVAMGMTKREDMLDICRIISEQLELLQVQDIRNVQTAIIDEAKHIYLNYEYYRKHDKTFITEVDYTIHPVQSAFALQMLRGKGSFFSTSLEGKKLDEFIEHQKAGPEFVDPFLFESVSLTWYWASLGPIAFGISTYSPLNEESQEIVKRFRNVFDLSYRRYLDIENAEAQAKEAQIETSLERVRAQAMAMRTPEDLTGICEVLYAELHTLGFTEIRNAMINIHDDAKESFVNYDYSDEIGKSINHLTYDVHPLIAKQIKQVKSTEGFSETSFTGKDLEDSIAFRKKAGEKDDPRMEKADALYYYFYSIGIGSIGISTFSVVAEEKLNVLKRFRNVFNLSYQRYTDIALAEVQAKEAKIELALERVRARTMAMQKSAELGETAYVLFQQFEELGEDPEQIGIGIMNEEDKILELWSTINGKMRERVVKVPLYEPILINKLYKAWKEDKKSVTVDISGKELEDYNKFRNSLAEIKIDTSRTNKRRVVSAANFSKGHITLATTEPRPAETLQLLERFAKVFDGTYTRFLDLQKSEAQSRESQVQLALERVRARTMAMQRSDELADTSLVLFTQIKELGFETWSCGFCTWQKDDVVEVWMGADSGGLLPPMMIPYQKEPTHKDIYEASLTGASAHDKIWRGEKLKEHYAFLKTIPSVKDAIDILEQSGLSLPEQQCYYVGFFEQGYLLLITKEPNDELKDLGKRFAKVFNQTYTRFLDLQKAEAQSRENQIQLALERARSQSMIMQHSNELDDTLRVFHEQVLLLNIPSAFSFLWLPDEKNDKHIFWAAWKEGENDSTVFKSKAINYPLDRNEPATAQCLIDWKGTEPIVSYHVPPAGVENYFAAWQELINGVEQLKPEHFSGGLYYVEAFMKYGCFGVIVTNDLTEDEKKILGRFAIEFERTYRRFLDLHKAEAQAREAQIEAALEKVRSRSLAMHKSDEIIEVVRAVFDRLGELNIELNTTFIIIFKEGSRDTEWWLINKDKNEFSNILVKYAGLSILKEMFETKEQGKELFSKTYYAEEKNELFHYLFTETDFKYAPPERQKYIFDNEAISISMAITGKISIQITRHNKISFSEADNEILKRFTKVFDQSYTRFLDLQKAEAQAREAQVEMALEKVRSRTMSMQRSDELPGTAALLFQEFKKLEQQELIQTTIGIYNEAKNEIEFRATNWEGGGEQVILPSYGSMDEPTLLKPAVTGWKAKAKSLVVDLTGKELEGWVNYRNKMTGVPISIKDAGGRRVVSIAFFSKGHLSLSSPLPLPAETIKTLERFAAVFDGTFTRFLDLQKSEAQAREAKIEASLERVRSKAMSMQKSEDLAAAITIVFEELDKLDLGILRCGIGILNKEKRCANVWTTTIADNNTIVQVTGDESMDIHPLLSGAFDAWLNHEDHSYTLKGEDLTNYYKAVAGENFKLPDSQSLVSGTKEMTQYYYNAVWSSGGLFAFRDNPFPEEAKIILRRFADVFTLTYTRYSDLKQAEAQAKEARIEVALERVRSRTLAMQRSDELAETAAVLFRQLISLGIAPNRLYISIIKNENGEAEFWITDEDGSKVSSAFETDLNNNPTFKKMFDGWKAEKKSIVIDMQGDELQEYFKYLTSINVPFKGGLEQKRRLQDIAYFGKGFIGIASPDEQPQETIVLLERFAAVFNLTYTRFNDLKIAEAHALQAEEDLIKLQTEKKRAEDALTELRSTQTQLIQSEKMASLGELTAGIAHEIQNPLNFVNNFSEVSNELIEELKTEKAKPKTERDEQLEEDLLNDIAQNLEKINHHGKRADAIVKGMLQHSRSSTSTKEPTDINKLADEYLRLAYHGLRAKDKSFNATLKTDYDETIGNINIIPQDIGRVVLNLITNAFYAVNTPQPPKGGVAYVPTVSVSTKKVNGKIEVSVSDNGTGIPKNIVDKIFQPFFTTKPTGQGTGLGLSLAYDIVKAHGGELKVETQENSGTTFIIQLPAI